MKKIISSLLFFFLQSSTIMYGKDCPRSSFPTTVPFVPDAVQVIDSCTLSVAKNGVKKKIKLYGICPTGVFEHDKQAERILKSLLAGRKTEIIVHDQDEDCRDTAVVFIDRATLNEEMIHNGRALLDKTCTANFCKAWIEDEKRVQAQKIGLWHDLDFAGQQQRVYHTILYREKNIPQKKPIAIAEPSNKTYTPKQFYVSPSYQIIRENTASIPSYSYRPSDFGSSKTVHVRDYYRKDGTHVRSHSRSAPRR